MRILGNLHRHTVQCHLPLGRFYDILAISIFFFFLILYTLSWLIVALRISRLFLCCPRRWLIRRYLSLPLASELRPVTVNITGHLIRDSEKEKNARKALTDFIDNHLLSDGYFIIRILSDHVDDLFIGDVINQLWCDINALHGAHENLATGESAPIGRILVKDESSRPLLTGPHIMRTETQR